MKEFTLPTIEALENLPENNNPFLHDHVHMGKEVSGAWLAMFSEHGGLKQNHNLTDKEMVLREAGERVFYDDPKEIIMVNQKTGQRFRIVFGE